MAVLAAGTAYTWIHVVGVGLVLQGLGQGLCGPSLHAAVADAVPQESLGIATAANRLVNQVALLRSGEICSGQVGTAVGIALLLGIYQPGQGASGYQPAFIAGGTMALLAVLAAGVMTRDGRRRCRAATS